MVEVHKEEIFSKS